MRNVKFIVSKSISKTRDQCCDEVKYGIDETLFIFENLRSQIGSQIITQFGNQIESQVEHKIEEIF